MKHKLTKVIHVLILLALLLPIGLQQAVSAGIATDPPPGQPVEPVNPEEDNPIYLPVLAVEAMQVYQISGRITDENDVPLSGVTVRSDGGHTTQTGPDGMYILSGLSEGLQDFTVISDAYYCSPVAIKINVPPNTERRNFTCSTQLLSVTGIIKDSDGNPMGGVIVTDNAGRQTTTFADGPDKGRYILELPAGIHTLTPTSPDYTFKPSAFTVRVGSVKVRTPEDASYDFTALASAWTPANITAPLTPLPTLTDRNLAVDKSGNLHIAFDSGGAAGTSTLWYGYYDGVAWTYIQVDTAAGTGQYAAIALDSRNRAHISYYDETNQRLKYARVVRTITGTFTTFVRTADSTNRGGKTTSIAVDHSDGIHIIYLDDDYDGLRYAYTSNPLINNGNFAIELINKPAGYLDEYPSLAVNSSNVPQISFYRIAPGQPETSASLNFAYRTGVDSWTVSTLATGLLRAEVFESLRRSPQDILDILAGVGLFNSLAIDSFDNVHIAYYNDDSDDLEYAGGGPGYWYFDIVDKIDHVGGFASIRVDSQNRPQISYIRQSQLPGSQGGALKFAIRLGDFWKTEFVDLIGPVTDGSRTNTTIFVDRADNPHILYYDFTTSDLKYVVRNKWDIQVVGLVGTLSEPSNRNIALDSNGLPHIAFGGSNLYHGYYDGNTWQFELVDPSATAGAFASIAMDWDDNIHIAYYDTGTQDLKYAFFNRRAGFWTIETVDSSGDVGKFTSLTLDSNAKPHIAYFDEDRDYLLYAYKSGSSWRIDIVDDSPAVGGYPSIALDSNDKPRIAYTDFGREELRYATKSGSSWSTTIVPLNGLVISFVSLEMDVWDRPHISFFEDTAAGDYNDNLIYVYHNGTQWVEDTIDADNSVGWWNSMRLDSQGDSQVSYYDLSSGKLKFATGSLYNWAVEFVDDMGIPPLGTPLTQVGGYTSLVLDKADRPNIVYYDITNNVLKFAKPNLWDMQTAATPAGALQEPGRPNIAIDVAGLPHIAYGDGTINYTFNDGFLWQVNPPPDPSPDTGAFATIATNYYGNNAWPYIAYYDTTNMQLMYNRLDGLGWLANPVIVDTLGDVGKYASIAIWQNDNTNPQDLVLHIAYFDEDQDDLKYARLTKDGGGRVEVVDSGGAVGPYPFIALDANGVPHISYYDISNKDLKYASRLGNDNWSTMVVDSLGKVGLFSSLAIDSHGNPHIAYFDDSYDDLRYTYFSGSSWYYEVVDTVDSTGWYASLALDNDDNPHIVYYDFSSQNLKHAFVYNYDWVVELVDIAGDVGQFASLQTDTAGGLHIAYYDATLLIIKYARSVDW